MTSKKLSERTELVLHNDMVGLTPSQIIEFFYGKSTKEHGAQISYDALILSAAGEHHCKFSGVDNNGTSHWREGSQMIALKWVNEKSLINRKIVNVVNRRIVYHAQ